MQWQHLGFPHNRHRTHGQLTPHSIAVWVTLSKAYNYRWQLQPDPSGRQLHTAAVGRQLQLAKNGSQRSYQQSHMYLRLKLEPP